MQKTSERRTIYRQVGNLIYILISVVEIDTTCQVSSWLLPGVRNVLLASLNDIQKTWKEWLFLYKLEIWFLVYNQSRWCRRWWNVSGGGADVRGQEQGHLHDGRDPHVLLPPPHNNKDLSGTVHHVCRDRSPLWFCPAISQSALDILMDKLDQVSTNLTNLLASHVFPGQLYAAKFTAVDGMYRARAWELGLSWAWNENQLPSALIGILVGITAGTQLRILRPMEYLG